MKLLTKICFVILFCTGLSIRATGQTFEPTILILSPHQTSADNKLTKEITEFNDLISETQGQNNQQEEALKEIPQNPANIRLMAEKQIEFFKEANFYSMIPSITEGYLQYRFYEKFENLLIYASKETSEGDVKDLSSIARRHQMRYIVNFPVVNSSVKKNQKATIIRIQLYDDHQQAVIWESDFTGDASNPGFEFACDEGSLICSINNALSPALNKIIETVNSGSVTILKERQLAQERASHLFSNYYSKEPPTEIMDVIARVDSSISSTGYYQGLINQERTQFIGFFAYNSDATNFQQLTNKEDKQVRIITDDPKNMNDIPGIYAFIVAGVKYKSKWYLSKDKVTYFNAADLETGRKVFFNNLQDWHFFKEGSSQVNPIFWDSYFFSKVESSADANHEEIKEYLMQMQQANDDEEKSMYLDMIDNYYKEDLKNQHYLGLYKIVAAELRKEDRKEREKFELHLSETVLTPFFDDYIQTSNNSIKAYKKLNNKDYALIYPRNKEVLLCPILFEYHENDSELHYFVFIPNDSKEYIPYKWEYFKPLSPEYNSMYGGDINDQLNTLTKWNFSFDYLEDNAFWSNYVLKKSADKYMYLTEIKH